MTKATQQLLGYEDFYQTHRLYTIPLSPPEKRKIILLANKTAKHFKQQYQRSDFEEAYIRAVILHAYLLGKREKRK